MRLVRSPALSPIKNLPEGGRQSRVECVVRIKFNGAKKKIYVLDFSLFRVYYIGKQRLTMNKEGVKIC